jgi:Icc-related predicted phosphoesterase
MRIAATADLHFTPQSYAKLKDQFERVRDEADVLVLAGDLTNFGQPEEMEPLLNVLVRLRLPTIVVLGNHDFECGKETELARMIISSGIKLLDGSAYERDGVGFAGTKGFVGGFGRGIRTAIGEREIKDFVRASIDEALKLERAMSQLRSPKRVVVLHYSPIADTVQGEAPEIFPFMGTSRLAEVVDVTERIWLCMAMLIRAIWMGVRPPGLRFTMSRFRCCKLGSLRRYIGCSMPKSAAEGCIFRNC